MMFAGRLSVLATLAAALLSSSAALAQISDDVVKIGVLTDMSGPASTPTGQGSVTAAQMAVDDFGGKVLGKPVSVIVGDHQLKPDIGTGIASAVIPGKQQLQLLSRLPGIPSSQHPSDFRGLDQPADPGLKDKIHHAAEPPRAAGQSWNL